MVIAGSSRDAFNPSLSPQIKVEIKALLTKVGNLARYQLHGHVRVEVSQIQLPNLFRSY
jgi:hypothetical protein